MKKSHLFIWMLMIIASILGVCGESLAYFVDEQIANTNPPIYYLTIFTIIFIFTDKKQKNLLKNLFFLSH